MRRIIGGQGRLPRHYSVYLGKRIIGTVYPTRRPGGREQWHAVATFHKTIGPWSGNTRDEAVTKMVDAVTEAEKAH